MMYRSFGGVTYMTYCFVSTLESGRNISINIYFEISSKFILLLVYRY